jgi:hypothetical protein
MRIPWPRILSPLVIVLIATLLSGASTTLWFLVFGSLAAPMLWLIVLVYVSMSRRLLEATFLTYLLTMVHASFTAFPASSLLIHHLTLVGLLVLIRERAFWGGPTYFMLMTSVASILALPLFWLISRAVDSSPLAVPELWDWLLSILWTVAFSLPLYLLFSKLDQWSFADAGEGALGPR